MWGKWGVRRGLAATLAGALAIATVSIATGSDAQEPAAPATAAEQPAAPEPAAEQPGGDAAAEAATVGPPSSLSLAPSSYAWKLADFDGDKTATVTVVNDAPRNACFELRLTLDGLVAPGEGGQALPVTDVLQISSETTAVAPACKGRADAGEVAGADASRKAPDDDAAVVATGSIPPGGTRTVAVAATDAKLAPGVYSGSVTALVRRDRGVARAALSLTVPGKGTVTPTPAATSQTMQAVRWIPFLDETVAVRGNWIPLAGAIPADVSKDDLTLGKSAYLGAIAGDKGGVAAIRYDNRVKQLRSRLAGIEIDARGFDGPGDYKGKLKLTATDSVDLTVVVKDSIIWAIAALGVGLLIALRVRRSTGDRQVALLDDDVTASHLALRAARRDFRRSARGHSWRELDSRADYERRIERLHKQVGDAGDRTWDEIPERERKEIAADVDELRAHAKNLGTLHESALALDAALDAVAALPKIEGALPARLPSQPAFVAGARELLSGDDLSVDRLDTRIAAIEAAAARVDDFPELHARVQQAVAWLGQLKANEPPGIGDELVEAEVALNGAWTQLWTAPDAEAAFAPGTIKALSTAYGKVAGLKAWRENVRERAGVGGVFGLTAARREMFIAPAEAEAAADLLDVAGWGAGDVVRAAPRDPVERRTYYATRIAGLSNLIVAFGIAAGLATGLTALYFGKNWGTPTDYLIAVLWGFTATTAVDTVVTALRERANPASLVAAEAADADKA